MSSSPKARASRWKRHTPKNNRFSENGQLEVPRQAVAIRPRQMQQRLILLEGLQQRGQGLRRGKDEVRVRLQESTLFESSAPFVMALVRDDQVVPALLEHICGGVQHRQRIVWRSPAIDDRAHSHGSIFFVLAPLSNHGPANVVSIS